MSFASSTPSINRYGQLLLTATSKQEKMAPVQNKMFQQQLDIASKRVLVYERVDLQLKARSCVPLDQLMQKAREQSTCELELRDMLLVELLNWFKQDFFSWFNTAHCNACNVAMIHNGLENPTREDLFFGAERVESYKCAACGKTDRFPRYNDPGDDLPISLHNYFNIDLRSHFLKKQANYWRLERDAVVNGPTVSPSFAEALITMLVTYLIGQTMCGLKCILRNRSVGSTVILVRQPVINPFCMRLDGAKS